ncbi:MAG: VWA domain-containing protein, partial [Methanoculleus sp.]|nr:VWA domain-containing protein [Methanoculleus sp.]
MTVEVLNGTSTPVPGAVVEFAVNNSTYGSGLPARIFTNDAGYATAVFKPGTTSGDVTFTATVAQDDSLKTSVDLGINHATPYRIANIWYLPEVTVGEKTNITVRIEDQYKNAVDNRNETETVSFMVGSPNGTAVFNNTADDNVAVSVDATGNATATLWVDTMAGEHLIYIQPPAPVRSDYISLFSVAGQPFDITAAVDPDDASVRANGEDKVSFTYTLFDKYGNPSPGQGLWVNASTKRVDQPDETYSRLLTSNSRGEVMIAYGPEDSVGVATLTATALGNESVTNMTVVEFTSTDPVNMLLTASPQSMPSREIQPNFVAELRAKVMDVKGNPVKDREVTFTLDNKSVNVNGNETKDGKPYLNEEKLNEEKSTVTVSVETDTNGFAIVKFHPGEFVGQDDPLNWSATARGNATVRATWGDVSRDITLTWMNYPYLSVETEVSRETVEVNETVDVTIRLKGDGYKLEPDPIDAVLVIDQSRSMRYNINHVNNDEDSNERMDAATAAAKTFIGNMTSDRDRVGLISFNSSTTPQNTLTASFGNVNTSLNALKPDGATQLRRGIYEAILMQNQTGRSDAIKAVIVMTDGDWNYDGSPIGHGTGYPENALWAYSFSGNTLEPDNYRYYDGLGGELLDGKSYGKWTSNGYKWVECCREPNKCRRSHDVTRDYKYCTNGNGEFTNQNMSRFASDNGVKLYTITFAYNPDDTVNKTMEILANSTGGFYEHAPSGDKLTDIYKRIAGDLKTEAGVNTTVALAFENVNVTGIDVPGKDVFDYVYDYGNSTHIYNRTGATEHFNKTINQTTQWNDDHALQFDIGTVRLGQTWEATFRLKVKMEGNINVFGPRSTISFNNGEEELELPVTYITAVKSLNNTGMDFQGLNISNLHVTGGVTDFLPVAWDLNYTGLETATEDV